MFIIDIMMDITLILSKEKTLNVVNMPAVRVKTQYSINYKIVLVLENIGADWRKAPKNVFPYLCGYTGHFRSKYKIAAFVSKTEKKN